MMPPAHTSATEDARAGSNVCEFNFDHACLRVRGDVSPSVLRLLIRELSLLPEAATR
jgi:hypothetical protein